MTKVDLLLWVHQTPCLFLFYYLLIIVLFLHKQLYDRKKPLNARSGFGVLISRCSFLEIGAQLIPEVSGSDLCISAWSLTLYLTLLTSGNIWPRASPGLVKRKQDLFIVILVWNYFALLLSVFMPFVFLTQDLWGSERFFSQFLLF